MQNRILLIDDDLVFHHIVKEIFHHVKTIRWFHLETDGASALDLLSYCKIKNDFPNHIFVDLRMPGIDGHEFLYQYNLIYYPTFPETQVHIVTSSDLETDRIRAFSYPFVRYYVTKPVSEENIQQILK